MTRRPFDQGELGGVDAEMDPMLADLERYLADTSVSPSSSFADEVMASVEHGPMPRRGAIGAVVAWFSDPGGAGRMTLLAATVAVAVLAVFALGRIGDLLPPPVGTSPSPTVHTTPSPEPSPSVRITPSPTPRESRSPRPSPRRSDGPDASDSPDATDDHGGGGSSPSPSDDNSGPGGGGNSGPGSSDDSSGHGSGSSSGSGSGTPGG